MLTRDEIEISTYKTYRKEYFFSYVRKSKERVWLENQFIYQCITQKQSIYKRKIFNLNKHTVIPLTVPNSSRIVNTSRSACVGCSPTPSPALMIGRRHISAACCTKK